MIQRNSRVRLPKMRRGWGWRWVSYLVLTLLSFGWCFGVMPTIAHLPPPAPAPGQLPLQVAATPIDEGQQFYQTGQFAAAATALEQAVQLAERAGNLPEQVTALRNLALVYQQLGQWEAAAQAIATSLNLVERLDAAQRSALLASVLDAQGSLQLAQGHPKDAIATWERSSTLYAQLGERSKAAKNQINQAQALQQIGFYRRSIEVLRPIVQALEPEPDSLTKAVALRSLGDGLQVAGDLAEARQRLEASLAIAERLSDPTAIANAQLSLASTLEAVDDRDAAVALYQKTAATAPPDLRVQAQLNELSLQIERGQLTPSSATAAQWAALQPALEALPTSHSTLFARINFAQSLIKLAAPQSPIAQFLATTIQQARSLSDPRAEADAIGLLGNLYERSGQWAEARQLSEQALALAQTQQALDVAYRWQWQLGRLFKAQADQSAQPELYTKAIAAYADALTTLQTLRTDLVAVNAQMQVSFQESVEPIHREFVSLLLDPRRGEANPAELEQALKVIESLQLAELDNFFREACLRTVPTQIDQVDQQAAVIYPILLADRLEVIVSLPQKHLRHYTSRVDRAEVEQLISQLRESLVLRVGNQYLPGVQQLYNWILRPAEADLASSPIRTIVFVLDGGLRNLPMSALHDGKQFLIEKYSVAITPGLQLLSPQPLQARNLQVFTAGLSESRQGFSALPNVLSEVKEIQSALPTKVLLNQNFTQAAFKQALATQSAPIVHLATHGKFSSKREETFVLTWDDRLNILTLNDVLQLSDLNQNGPIELLVLSACQTAAGDRLAALGMAGMAVRAGARSTIASLWQINDEATAILMNRFYEILTHNKTTKAEALRQAQLTVLKEPRFRQHPYFWSPYVLVGNWL